MFLPSRIQVSSRSAFSIRLLLLTFDGQRGPSPSKSISVLPSTRLEELITTSMLYPPDELFGLKFQSAAGDARCQLQSAPSSHFILPMN